MKEYTRWYSERVEREVGFARWGHYGAPVLLFPTAGGDAEEAERMGLIDALWPLIDAGRIKVYSCDSVNGQVLLAGDFSPEHYCWIQNQFDAYVYHEVVPAIRMDCKSPAIEIITTGASIGAFNAVASLCRHPDVFRLAIALSGHFDLEHFLHGRYTEDFYFSSPLHYLPNLGEGAQLDLLRQRFILMVYGEGRWEDPDDNWRMAQVLGAKGIPNRVDVWGPQYDHDWPAWREQLPKYLSELA